MGSLFFDIVLNWFATLLLKMFVAVFVQEIDQ